MNNKINYATLVKFYDTYSIELTRRLRTGVSYPRRIQPCLYVYAHLKNALANSPLFDTLSVMPLLTRSMINCKRHSIVHITCFILKPT
jgi:hypothetical protein